VLVDVRRGAAVLPEQVVTRTDGLSGPAAAALADLNGDGRTDRIVANGDGNNVLVFVSQSEGGFRTLSFPTGSNPVGLTVGDLNDDGLPDLAVADQGSDDVSVLIGEGTGDAWTFRPRPRLKLPPAGAGPVAVEILQADEKTPLDLRVSSA